MFRKSWSTSSLTETVRPSKEKIQAVSSEAQELQESNQQQINFNDKKTWLEDSCVTIPEQKTEVFALKPCCPFQLTDTAGGNSGVELSYILIVSSHPLLPNTKNYY